MIKEVKNKKITVWTMKGGDGKTNIALELALRLDYSIITNEPYTILDKVLDEERLLQLENGQNIPETGEFGIIFDFGGYIDHRVIDAISQSDVVIVPTIAETSDVQGCLNTIGEIKKYNQNILVVANRLEKDEDLEFVRESVKQIGDYFVLPLKKSRALPNIYLEKKSIAQTMEEGSLKKYLYQKVGKQFEEIINYIFK